MHKVGLGVAVLAAGLVVAPVAACANEAHQRRHQERRDRHQGPGSQLFGCTGQNMSPSLNWSGAPKEPRASSSISTTRTRRPARGFWHWVVFNIPVSTTSLPKNAGDLKAKLMPDGAIQSRTDYGATGYGGMCPPQGDKPHHYH